VRAIPGQLTFGQQILAMRSKSPGCMFRFLLTIMLLGTVIEAVARFIRIMRRYALF